MSISEANKVSVKSSAKQGQRVVKLTQNGETTFLPVGLSSLNPNGGNSGGGASDCSTGGISIYKCVSVDTGVAYPDYTNINVSGVTPADMNTEYTQNDPTLLGFNRIWSANGKSVGWDKNNSAWCIYEGDGEPNFVSALFYAQIGALSTETGDFENPKFWDSSDVVSGNRMLTVDFNSEDAPYDDYSGEQGWNVYANLKANTEYTIGLTVPPSDDETGEYYEGSIYVYDDTGTSVAYAYELAEQPVNIGGKEITMYCTYTPTKDGMYRLAFSGGWGSSFISPIACSPAPEITTAPKTDIFDQNGNWKIGGGIGAGIRVTAAGTESCNGDYHLIQGDGTTFESVWQNANGIYIRKYDKGWCMSTVLEGIYIFRTNNQLDTSKGIPHPATVKWDTRYSSSNGDLPVVELLPTTEVSGSPALTPIEMAGREARDYSVWSGVKMEQVDGVWKETEERKDGMKSTSFTPAIDGIYNEDCSIVVKNAYKNRKKVLCWGNNSSGVLGVGHVNSVYKATELSKIYKTMSTGTHHTLAIDEEGYLWGWGLNNNGQIINTAKTEQYTPIKITEKSWSQAFAGGSHSAALDTDGYLYTWGNNGYGQLADGTTTNKSVPTQVGTKKYKSIYADQNRTIAIDEDGYMWGAGQNRSGYFGTGSTSNLSTLTQIGTKRWQSICSSYEYGGNGATFAVDEDGYLWATGDNGYGKLGIGNSTNVTEWTQAGGTRLKKVCVSPYHSVGINEEGFLCLSGSISGVNNVGDIDFSGKFTRIPGIGKVKDCYTTSNGTYYIDESGRLYGFASGSEYLLGIDCKGYYTAGTIDPVHILPEYTFEWIVAKDSMSRFALVKE